jgi:carbamoyl-phosphate synthase large subunit
VARGIPCITTMTGATAAQRAIRALRSGEPEVRSLQELHAARREAGRATA